MRRVRQRRRRISILFSMILFLAAAYGVLLLVTFLSARVTSCSAGIQKAKAAKLMEKTDDYPEELLDMLSRNPDMLNFVEGYPEKKGQVFADSIGDVKKGEYPLLLQWDERWGYGNYGTSCMAVSGCAPTVISMAIAGLTGDDSITPYTVASYAEEHGYYVPGSGTSWSLISEGIQHFGLFSQELPLSRDSVFQALESGTPIICSMRPGDFTTTGHFILLVGIEDGKVQVRDPNSTQRSEKLWDYETLEPQIHNLWAVNQ